MFRVLVLSSVIGLIYCQGYGVPSADNTAPQYPAAQPPVVVYPLPAPAPVLPELPASHEFLYPRRRHGHRSSSSSSRSSDSSGDDGYGKRCRSCNRISTSCERIRHHHTVKPNIVYYKQDGCRFAVISCPTSQLAFMKVGRRQVLTVGVGMEKQAKCAGPDWKTRDIQGNVAEFDKVCCYVRSFVRPAGAPSATNDATA